MRPHTTDPAEPLPVLPILNTFALRYGYGIVSEAERADAWLRSIDEALAPIARRLAAETPLSITAAAELVHAWYQNVPLSPTQELAVLKAAGDDGSLRAAVLGVQIAADDLIALLGTSLARPAGAAARQITPEVPVPLTRRERRAQRRAARRG